METYREITIAGSVYPSEAFYHRWAATEYQGSRPHGPRPIVPVDRVLEQIRAAERDGVRALVVVWDSLGGNNACGLRIYHALRDFPGSVVCYVRRAWSMAPIVAQAADRIVIDPDGKIVVHGSIPTRSAPDVSAASEPWVEILERRLGMPPFLARGLLEDHEKFWQSDAEASVRLGLADVVGGLEDARRLAAELANGAPGPSTARSRKLTAAAALALALATGCAGGAPTGFAETSSGDGAIDPEAPGYMEDRIVGVALSNWTSAVTPTGVYRDAAMNGDRIVAVGNGVSAYSDDDGETWTAGGALMSTVSAVTYFAAVDKFVAIPNTGQIVALSADGGATWTQYATALPSTTWLAVRDIGTRVVAIGTWMSGTKWCASYSTDGQTWSSPVTVIGDAPSVPTASSVSLLTWTGSTLILASGTESASGWFVYTSPDGTTWTKRTVLAGTPGVEYHGRLATSGSSVLFFARASSSSTGVRVFRSEDDGVTWADTDHDLPSTVSIVGLTTIFGAAGGYVAVDALARDIYLARDAGKTWLRRIRPAGFTGGNPYMGSWTGRRALIVGDGSHSPYLGAMRSLQL